MITIFAVTVFIAGILFVREENLSAGAKMVPVTNDDRVDNYSAQIIAPILADGEIVGSLIMINRDAGQQMTEVDQKVAETTANIIGRQMEQ